MFSLPFLFPSSKEPTHQGTQQQQVEQGVENHNQDEYDSSSSCSSSSNESDSRFMNEQGTSFVALHPHQRVQNVNHVVEQESHFFPLHIHSKGYDDVSQVSFDYESSVTSLDTSVDLNPYANGNNGQPSHLEIAMRWRRNLAKQQSLGSISDVPRPDKAAAENTHVSNTREEESNLSSYISFQDSIRKMQGGVEGITEANTVTSKNSKNSRSSTGGYIGNAETSPVLERSLRIASVSAAQSERTGTINASSSANKKKVSSVATKKSAESLEAASRANSSEQLPPPAPPQIVKKRYSGSQFQISPLATSRKDMSSDYPLSEAQGRFTTKANKEKDHEKKPEVRLVLGFGRDMPNSDVKVEGGIIIMPVDEAEGNGSVVESDRLMASAVNWPKEGIDVLFSTPKSRKTNDSFRSPHETYSASKLEESQPTPTYKTPPNTSALQTGIGDKSIVTEYSSNHSDASSFLKSSPCRHTPSLLLSGPPVKNSFLKRLDGLTKHGTNEIKEFGTDSRSPDRRTGDARVDVVNLLDPSLDPMSASVAQGVNGLQRRTKKWVTQIWSPESEEWDYVQDETFTATTPKNIVKYSEDPDKTMPLSDEDEDSLECIFKQADEEERQCQIKSSLFQPSLYGTKTLTMGIGKLSSPGIENSNHSDSSESSLAYSMSSASMMVPPGNEIEGTLSKPIAFRRARGSPIAPSKFGRSSAANIHANSAMYDTKRLSIMKAAEFNYSLLTEFDEQDRHIAATMIQITYRGFCDRHLVMEMVSDQLESKSRHAEFRCCPHNVYFPSMQLGVAKRKRHKERKKSLSVTKIHSNFRRAARQVLRSKHEETRKKEIFVASMAVAVRQVCAILIQKWWKKHFPLLKAKRSDGFHSSAIPSSWNKQSVTRKVPEFIFDKDRDYGAPAKINQKQLSPSSADSKRTATSNSSTSERFDKDYYNRSHANLYEDDIDGALKAGDETFEISVSLLKKLHNGVVGRFVKIFRKRPNGVETKNKSMKRLKNLFKRRKKGEKRAHSPSSPMLGDPDVNAELPDPLSLYRPLEDEGQDKDYSSAQEVLFDVLAEETIASKEQASQWNFDGDFDAFSIMAESFANNTQDGDFSTAHPLEDGSEKDGNVDVYDDDFDLERYYSDDESECSLEESSSLAQSTSPTILSTENESMPWDER